MPTEEEIKIAKSRPKERHLTNKYNYAGPGTFFKARQKGSKYYEDLMKASGRKLVGTKPYNKPINGVDRCAVTHDRSYGNPKSTGDDIQQADRNFQTCVKKMKPGSISEALLAKAAVVGFEGKIAMENVGVLRKGSHAQGGESEKDHAIRVGHKLMDATGLGKKTLKTNTKGTKIN